MSIATKDITLLLLRLSGLGLAIGHGWPKIGMLASGNGGRFVEAVAGFGFPMPTAFAWAAALSEFAGGLLIASGLLTRIAAGFAAFTMFIAAFFRHKFASHVLLKLGLLSVSEETHESWGNPEMAMLYLLIFVTVGLTGGGAFALDKWVFRKR